MITISRSGLLAAAVAVLAIAAALAWPARADENANPVVSAAFGPDGRLWRVTPGKNTLVLDYSVDLGKTFVPRAVIEPRRQRLRIDPEGRPQIAFDSNGTLYLAWTADAHKPMQSFVTWSTDDGRTFSTPVSPGEPAPLANQLRPFLLGGKAGAWLYFLSPAPRAAGPASAGTLFESVIQIDEPLSVVTTPIATSTCECCRLDADTKADGTRVILSRMVFPGGMRDFGVVQMTPGAAPSPVVRVTDDDWKIDACPEHGAALAIGADGRYHLTWFTQGARRQGLFYAWSDDQGHSWSAPLRIGTPDALPGHADVLVQGSDVYLVWQEFDGTRSLILTMNSADNGVHWSAPQTAASSSMAADYPMLLTNGKAVFISWFTSTEGYRLFPLPGTVAALAAKQEIVLRNFVTGSLPELVAAYRGKPFLLVLWSIDCAPCLREFEQIATLRREGYQVPLVLINTDDFGRYDAVRTTLLQFGLANDENWIFADGNTQKLRFEIDAAWYGELPRSYYYKPEGGRKAHSGGLTRAEIEMLLPKL